MNMRKAQLYINGTWVEEPRAVEPVKNPYTGEVIGEQQLATPDDVERALASAFAAKKTSREFRPMSGRAF